MLVEIFDERELDSSTLQPEQDSESLELIKELGLKTHETGERISYPRPTTEQAFVLKTLFPTQTPVKEYEAGCIPLRVLKEIRSYLAENPSHRLYVLHEAPAVLKDPVLIACDTIHSWQDTQPGTWRLVARWGAALEDWRKLTSVAAIQQSETLIAQCKDLIARLAAQPTRQITLDITYTDNNSKF